MKNDVVFGAEKQSGSPVGAVLGQRGCRFFRGPAHWQDHEGQLAAAGRKVAGLAHDLANVFQVVMADAEAIARNVNNPARVAESARRIGHQATLGVRILTTCREPGGLLGAATGKEPALSLPLAAEDPGRPSLRIKEG